MPRNGYFFDAIIRQQPYDEENLNVNDNLEDFGPVSETDLEYWKVTAKKARDTGKAVIAGLGGTALGDIAHVPGIKLKNPKGIRDIADWYMSILIRPEYIMEIFERQTEIALDNFTRLYQCHRR
jgi:hypothetical protein